MLKWIGLSVWMVWLSVLDSYATTVPNPSIRYTIGNKTGQKIITLIQLESNNQRFLTADTVGIINSFDEGLVIFQSRNRTLKPYQKLIIETNRQQYQTPALLFNDRCKAWTIQLTGTDLSVQDDYSFILRRWVIEILIIVFLTLAIKGVPILLLTASQFRHIYRPFLIMNGLFCLCLLTLLNFSFWGLVQAGPVESKYFYLTLLVVSLVECFWYYRSVVPLQHKIRVLTGTILGSLLWSFPGYMITLFALFLFAHC